MAAQIKGKQTFNMHDGSALLGFQCMVAPTSETAHKGGPAFLTPPFQGLFQKCWGESMPPPKWTLVCTWLSGKAYWPNKSVMKLQRLTWGT